jgi:anti-sigma factor RsiW
MDTEAEYSALIQPYLDGELTKSEEQRLLSHLEGCPNCRKELEDLKTFSARLRQVRPMASTPESLKQRIAALMAESDQHNEALDVPRGNVLQIKKQSIATRRWVPALVAAALCIATGVTVWATRMRPEEAANNFVKTAITAHKGLINASMPLDVRSDSPKVVSAWFSSRVPFAFRMPNANIASEDLAKYKLLGGRLISFAGEPAALLVFQINNEPVSVLVASGKKAQARGGLITYSNGIKFHATDRDDLHVVTWENVQLVYALSFSNKISEKGSCSTCHQSSSPAITAKLSSAIY